MMLLAQQSRQQTLLSVMNAVLIGTIQLKHTTILRSLIFTFIVGIPGIEPGLRHYQCRVLTILLYAQINQNQNRQNLENQYLQG
jgi:hypothetical protein